MEFNCRNNGMKLGAIDIKSFIQMIYVLFRLSDVIYTYVSLGFIF